MRGNVARPAAAFQFVGPVPSVEGGVDTKASMLEANMTVAMTTTMARVAPRIAVRTGVAEASASGSRAKRIPGSLLPRVAQTMMPTWPLSILDGASGGSYRRGGVPPAQRA